MENCIKITIGNKSWDVKGEFDLSSSASQIISQVLNEDSVYTDIKQEIIDELKNQAENVIDKEQKTINVGYNDIQDIDVEIVGNANAVGIYKALLRHNYILDDNIKRLMLLNQRLNKNSITKYNFLFYKSNGLDSASGLRIFANKDFKILLDADSSTLLQDFVAANLFMYIQNSISKGIANPIYRTISNAVNNINNQIYYDNKEDSKQNHVLVIWSPDFLNSLDAQYDIIDRAVIPAISYNDNNSYEIQITKRITTDDVDMFVVSVSQTLDNGDALEQESFLPISRKKGVDFSKYRDAFNLYKSDKIVADTVEEPISLSQSDFVNGYITDESGQIKIDYQDLFSLEKQVLSLDQDIKTKFFATQMFAQSSQLYYLFKNDIDYEHGKTEQIILKALQEFEMTDADKSNDKFNPQLWGGVNSIVIDEQLKDEETNVSSHEIQSNTGKIVKVTTKEVGQYLRMLNQEPQEEFKASDVVNNLVEARKKIEGTQSDINVPYKYNRLQNMSNSELAVVSANTELFSILLDDNETKQSTLRQVLSDLLVEFVKEADSNLNISDASSLQIPVSTGDDFLTKSTNVRLVENSYGYNQAKISGSLNTTLVSDKTSFGRMWFSINKKATVDEVANVITDLKKSKSIEITDIPNNFIETIVNAINKAGSQENNNIKAIYIRDEGFEYNTDRMIEVIDMLQSVSTNVIVISTDDTVKKHVKALGANVSAGRIYYKFGNLLNTKGRQDIKGQGKSSVQLIKDNQITGIFSSVKTKSVNNFNERILATQIGGTMTIFDSDTTESVDCLKQEVIHKKLFFTQQFLNPNPIDPKIGVGTICKINNQGYVIINANGKNRVAMSLNSKSPSIRDISKEQDIQYIEDYKYSVFEVDGQKLLAIPTTKLIITDITDYQNPITYQFNTEQYNILREQIMLQIQKRLSDITGFSVDQLNGIDLQKTKLVMIKPVNTNAENVIVELSKPKTKELVRMYASENNINISAIRNGNLFSVSDGAVTLNSSKQPNKASDLLPVIIGKMWQNGQINDIKTKINIHYQKLQSAFPQLVKGGKNQEDQQLTLAINLAIKLLSVKIEDGFKIKNIQDQDIQQLFKTISELNLLPEIQQLLLLEDTGGINTKQALSMNIGQLLDTYNSEAISSKDICVKSVASSNSDIDSSIELSCKL